MVCAPSPKKSKPKHLLWTLYFLKVYTREAPGCSTVGGSKGAIDPKTLRKWVWLFIERIAELADEVVSIFCHADARILAHRRLTSPFLPRPSSASHRSTLRAGSVPTTSATTDDCLMTIDGTDYRILQKGAYIFVVTRKGDRH